MLYVRAADSTTAAAAVAGTAVWGAPAAPRFEVLQVGRSEPWSPVAPGSVPGSVVVTVVSGVALVRINITAVP